MNRIKFGPREDEVSYFEKFSVGYYKASLRSFAGHEGILFVIEAIEVLGLLAIVD
jgi:hypothetical protein